ncbi:MAG TPA: 23S rRNA (uracil(1939)-C(5))-methyltransferase RlmD, partial [Lachnospiraceae bacterium]|nr:23S rRNA (uracil(1939)-C(5))-methyltransferase RlmD [Lachnospiraceae bacterium]
KTGDDSRADGKKDPVTFGPGGGDIISFTIDVDEETYTLLKFDVVNLDGPVQQELRESIAKEGITIYEKI